MNPVRSDVSGSSEVMVRLFPCPGKRYRPEECPTVGQAFQRVALEFPDAPICKKVIDALEHQENSENGINLDQSDIRLNNAKVTSLFEEVKAGDTLVAFSVVVGNGCAA